MEIINWNREIQEQKIGVPSYTGNIIVDANGNLVAESVISKASFEDAIFEVVGCERMSLTSITELKSSNFSIEQQILEKPEQEEALRAIIDENNTIIALIEAIQ